MTMHQDANEMDSFLETPPERTDDRLTSDIVDEEEYLQFIGEADRDPGDGSEGPEAGQPSDSSESGETPEEGAPAVPEDAEAAPPELVEDARKLGLPDAVISAFDNVAQLQAYVDKHLKPEASTPAPSAAAEEDEGESLLDDVELDPDVYDEEIVSAFGKMKKFFKQELGLLAKQVDEIVSTTQAREFDSLFAGLDEKYADVLGGPKTREQLDPSSETYRNRGEVIELMNSLVQRGVTRSEAFNRAVNATFPQIVAQQANRQLAQDLKRQKGSIVARGSADASNVRDTSHLSPTARIARKAQERFGDLRGI